MKLFLFDFDSTLTKHHTFFEPGRTLYWFSDSDEAKVSNIKPLVGDVLNEILSGKNIAKIVTAHPDLKHVSKYTELAGVDESNRKKLDILNDTTKRELKFYSGTRKNGIIAYAIHSALKERSDEAIEALYFYDDDINNINAFKNFFAKEFPEYKDIPVYAIHVNLDPDYNEHLKDAACRNRGEPPVLDVQPFHESFLESMRRRVIAQTHDIWKYLSNSGDELTPEFSQEVETAITSSAGQPATDNLSKEVHGTGGDETSSQDESRKNNVPRSSYDWIMSLDPKKMDKAIDELQLEGDGAVDRSEMGEDGRLYRINKRYEQDAFKTTRKEVHLLSQAGEWDEEDWCDASDEDASASGSEMTSVEPSHNIHEEPQKLSKSTTDKVPAPTLRGDDRQSLWTRVGKALLFLGAFSVCVGLLTMLIATNVPTMIVAIGILGGGALLSGVGVMPYLIVKNKDEVNHFESAPGISYAPKPNVERVQITARTDEFGCETPQLPADELNAAYETDKKQM